MNLRTVAAVVAIIALLGAGGFFGVKALLGSGDSGPKPGRLGVDTLDGVDLNRLASGGGVTVSAPALGYVARASIDDAKRVASGVYPGVAVKQVLLARVKIDGMGIDTQAWVVNFDPKDPHLDSPNAEGTVTYALALVDADSGRLLYSIGEQAPPPGGFHKTNFLTPGHPMATPDAPVTPTPAQ